MNLIEEIEAALKLSLDIDTDLAITAWRFTETPYWPRIRAALLAAQEMDKQLVKSGSHDANSSECLSCTAQRKFRKAMEGNKP